MDYESSDFSFFDPTDHAKALLPLRKLTKLDLTSSSMLIEVNEVTSLTKSSKSKSIKLPKLKSSFGKKASSKVVEALSSKRILGFVYKFLVYDDLILHSRTNRLFCNILRRLPMSIVCSGAKAANFCMFIQNSIERLISKQAFYTLTEFSIGNTDESLRVQNLDELIVGFKRNLFPSVRSFHIVINPDAGENGIFDLVDAMLMHPLESLTNLDFSGSYMGESATRKLAEIFSKRLFSKTKILNLSRNGTGEYGTRFLMNALSTNKACDGLEHLNLSRNGMGSGFRVVPKCITSESLNPFLRTLNLSNNDIQGNVIHDACNDLNGSLPHNLTNLDLSANPFLVSEVPCREAASIATIRRAQRKAERSGKRHNTRIFPLRSNNQPSNTTTNY